MNSVVKQREILFSPLHPDPNQAQTAMLVLRDLDGIERADAPEPTRLVVRYLLPQQTLADIEELLRELGFHLDNSLLCKLKRALYYYTDETERANLGCSDGQCKTTRDVFVQQYRKRPHGCRDQRPAHWRSYL
ncbi:MAG TPA: hypothetical protein EYP40_06085 [Chromatiales bacterium]|nr:hypothetical protein [Chromatiales bacterium]